MSQTVLSFQAIVKELVQSPPKVKTDPFTSSLLFTNDSCFSAQPRPWLTEGLRPVSAFDLIVSPSKRFTTVVNVKVCKCAVRLKDSFHSKPVWKLLQAHLSGEVIQATHLDEVRTVSRCPCTVSSSLSTLTHKGLTPHRINLHSCSATRESNYSVCLQISFSIQNKASGGQIAYWACKKFLKKKCKKSSIYAVFNTLLFYLTQRYIQSHRLQLSEDLFWMMWLLLLSQIKPVHHIFTSKKWMVQKQNNSLFFLVLQPVGLNLTSVDKFTK